MSDAMDNEGRELREKAMAAKQAVADLISEARRLAVDSFGDLQDSTRGWVEGTTERATEGAKGVEEFVVDYVKEHPFRTVAMAVSAGFLLGFVMKNRS